MHNGFWNGRNFKPDLQSALQRAQCNVADTIWHAASESCTARFLILHFALSHFAL